MDAAGNRDRGSLKEIKSEGIRDEVRCSYGLS